MRLLLVAALLCAGGCSVDYRPQTQEEFFPLKDHSGWAFQDAKGQKHSISLNLAPFGKMWSLAIGVDNQWMLVPDDTGLRLLGLAGGHGVLPFDPPLLFLPKLLTAEDWSSSATLKSIPGATSEMHKLSFTLTGSPPTTLPVGSRTLQARSVEFRIVDESQKRTSITRLWLAPAEGIVRVEFVGGNIPGGDTWTRVDLK